MQVLGYFLARFSESSSYAGLAGVLALVGIHVSDGETAALVQALAGLCGLVALFLKERGALKSLAWIAVLGIGAVGPVPCQASPQAGADAAVVALQPAAEAPLPSVAALAH